jgi:hypothetical protein
MLSVEPSAVGAYRGRIETNLSSTLPRSWRPGRISRSGTEVSTMVETMAM